MTFKEWLCKKAGMEYNRHAEDYITWNNELLKILIKAMWNNNINTKRIYDICILTDMVRIESIKINPYIGVNTFKYFKYKYSQSEQHALESALKYIYEQEQ